MRTWNVLALALLVGCGGDAMGGPDAGPALCEERAPLEQGGEGHAEPLGAAAGEARAGRIEEGEIPASRTGLGRIEEGDFVLANDRVAIVIEDLGASDFYDRYGGRPVGIARVEGGALVEAADFGEVILGAGANWIDTESVGVIDDGSGGGAAIVRTTGPLAAVDILGDLLPPALQGNVGGWQAALDFALEPDAEEVTVTMTLDSRSPSAGRIPFVVMGFVQTYRMPLWAPTVGFGTIEEAAPWIAYDDAHATSYAWVAPAESPLRFLLDETGINVMTMRAPALPACERTAIPLGTIAIGARVDGAQAVARRALGESTRTITGTVVETGGGPAADVRVHVTEGEAHVTRALVAADGTFSIEVPDRDVELWAYRRGFAPVGPLAVARGTGTATITMPPSGRIEVRAVDEGGAPLPVRAQVMGDVTRPPESFGEIGVASGRLHVEFAGADGIARAMVPPGDHRVVVTRGYEHELVDEMVTVTAGATATLDAVMVHSVDTTGVMCADYHIHTMRSPDSYDDARFKILGLVADGLEIPVRSDHDFVAAFDPVVQELGLEAFALGISGEELTTFTYGHFGVFPLEPVPGMRNDGSIDWIGRLPPAVFADTRARPGSPALIVNHPRTGGSFGGYFTAAQYDPATGVVGRMDHWDEAFTLVEVMNDTSFEQNREAGGTETVRDWLSFLRAGRHVFAIGSSDSHKILSNPVGYPRTCLALGTDDPRAVTPAMVRDVTAAGRSYVSGGVQIEARASGGVGPGGEASGVGDRASIEVVVRAATWIDVDALEVIVDGETTETIPLTDAEADPTDATVRFRGTVEAPVAAGGSFVIVHASGGDPLEPLHPGRMPFAVTNPIFLRR